MGRKYSSYGAVDMKVALGLREVRDLFEGNESFRKMFDLKEMQR